MENRERKREREKARKRERRRRRRGGVSHQRALINEDVFVVDIVISGNHMFMEPRSQMINSKKIKKNPNKKKRETESERKLLNNDRFVAPEKSQSSNIKRNESNVIFVNWLITAVIALIVLLLLLNASNNRARM